VCYISCPCHPPSHDHSNYVLGKEYKCTRMQIMNMTSFFYKFVQWTYN
jgi:hypothetical protein